MVALKIILATVITFILFYMESVTEVQSAERLVGQTKIMSPTVWFCDSPENLDILLNQKTEQSKPDHIPGCRKFADGALVTIHALVARQILGAEAVLLRVAVDGYGTQYVIYDWRAVMADEI